MHHARVRRWTGIGAVVLVLAVVAAACGGDDNSTPSVSSGGAKTSDGNDVLEIQRQLNALGCNVGPLDGTLGPDTEAGIRQFQSVASLTVDGIVGQSTRAALEAASQSGGPRCPATPPPPPPTSPPTNPSSPTTGKSNTPPCTEAAIRPPVTAGLSSGEQLFKLNPFNCAITWAVTNPTVGTTQQDAVDITLLLRWNGSAWQVVDRGVYCDNGDVPKTIYQNACESN